MEIGGRQRGLPVVRLRDVGHEARRGALGDVGPDARQRGVALGVVGPVAAVGAKIRIARPIIEMRRFEHEELEPLRARRQDFGVTAEEIGIVVDPLGVLELAQHLGIAG